MLEVEGKPPVEVATFRKKRYPSPSGWWLPLHRPLGRCSFTSFDAAGQRIAKRTAFAGYRTETPDLGEVADGARARRLRGHATVRRAMDPNDGPSQLPRSQGRRTSPPPPSSARSSPGTGSRPAPRPASRTSPARTAGWPGCERCSRAGTTAERPQGDRVHPDTRAEWRAWLAEHHDGSDGVWLVLWRKQSGLMGLTYEEAVQEALCFGWIDSKGSKLDDERTMLWMSPRKRGSGWARTNKVRIEQLLADGPMTPAGLALIEEAKRDGSGTLLDDVENLVVPDDLAERSTPTRGPGRWDALPLGAPVRAGADRPGQAPLHPGQAGRLSSASRHRPGRAARPAAARFLTPSPGPVSAAHGLHPPL